MIEKALTEIVRQVLREVVRSDLQPVLREIIRQELAAAREPSPPSPSPPQHASAAQYLRARDLLNRFGVSRVTLYRWVVNGTFPAPTRLGCSRTTFWNASDVERWEKDTRRRG